jgi:hypothetical protein
MLSKNFKWRFKVKPLNGGFIYYISHIFHYHTWLYTPHQHFLLLIELVDLTLYHLKNTAVLCFEFVFQIVSCPLALGSLRPPSS